MESPVDRLIRLDRETPRQILVMGDPMIDVWRPGRLVACQDHCPAFLAEEEVSVPGGAAGAARQLARWNSRADLVGPVGGYGLASPEGLTQRAAFPGGHLPRKCRLVEGGKIVWRLDREWPDYGLSREEMAEARHQAMLHLCSDDWGAVLLSDYDKGFLGCQMIREVVEYCKDSGTPVVADCKRAPHLYDGAVRKMNLDYFERWFSQMPTQEGWVVTDGPESPMTSEGDDYEAAPPWQTVPCKNHIGAGDCFAAHLALALAHKITLKEAAALAHSAGRVYVQHPYGRPPWPHEIRKDYDPVGGKVLGRSDLAPLREGSPGRVVFTNGCFRIVHAAHAAFLRWAKSQGDVLVVGVNDDACVARLRPGKAFRPLGERLEVLAGFSCVDWVVPFGEDTPEGIIGLVKPDVLVKGDEYKGISVPGDTQVAEILFAPPGPYGLHASDLLG